MTDPTKTSDFVESNTGQRARRVTPMPPQGAQVHNRERPSVSAAIERVTWPESSKVRNVTVTVMHTVAAPADESAGIAIVFNAADLTEATGWLTETDSEAGDVERYVIPANSVAEFPFGDNIINAYFVAIGAGAETLRVHISGGASS